MGRPKGSKNKPKLPLPVVLTTNETSVIVHPIISCAAFLTEHMSDMNAQYWKREARRHGMTLHQKVVEYLVGDFGVNKDEFKDFLKKRDTVQSTGDGLVVA